LIIPGYFLSTESELDLSLGSQSSTGNMWQWYQEKLTVYTKNLSNQCNFSAQIEQVQD